MPYSNITCQVPLLQYNCTKYRTTSVQYDYTVKINKIILIYVWSAPITIQLHKIYHHNSSMSLFCKIKLSYSNITLQVIWIQYKCTKYNTTTVQCHYTVSIENWF
jgi:hypothetical protein